MSRAGRLPRALVGARRVLLAIDEGNPTYDKRFAAAGIQQTVEMRRATEGHPGGQWSKDCHKGT